MIATIHQPDFMPWYGLFQKISRSDTWVVLDHTENNPRDAAFWGRRVKILNNGKEQWFSVTLNKPETGGVGMPINEMKINTVNNKQSLKQVKTIQMAYAKTPYFKEYFSLIEDYFLSGGNNLMERNMLFIKEVMSILKINTKIVYSSSLNVDTKSTTLLVDLISKVNADTYLCGEGGRDYQDEKLFKSNNINLVYNEVNHFKYNQLRCEQYVAGLSIIDGLFHLGGDALSENINY